MPRADDDITVDVAADDDIAVDVVVVAWNAEEHLDACLTALAAQRGVAVRVTVIDNASADATLLVASAHEGVRVVANSDNVGFAGAANQGWALSSAPFVMTLNPDVSLEPDCLATLVAEMRGRPDVGWITPLLVNDGGTVDSAGHSFHHPRLFRNRGQGLPSELAPASGYVFGATGAAALYRREALGAAAAADPAGRPWDDGCFAYWEDVDLDWRLQRLGYRCWYERTARGRHVRGVARRRAPEVVEMLNYRNRFRVIWRNDSLAGFLAHLPGFLATTALKTGDLLVTHPKAFVKAVRTLRFGARPRGSGRPSSERFAYGPWLKEHLRRVTRRR